MSERPRGRSEGIFVEKLDAELVVYDSAINQAHSLDAIAARVWFLADGGRTVAEIAQLAELDEAGAVAALDQLAACGLMVEEPGVSRRWMLRRAAVVGAGAVAAAPLIETVVIPTAVAHASTPGPTNPGNPGGNPGGNPPVLVMYLYYFNLSSPPTIGLGVFTPASTGASVIATVPGTSQFQTGFGTLELVAGGLDSQNNFTLQIKNVSGNNVVVQDTQPYVLAPGQSTGVLGFNPSSQIYIHNT